MNSLKLKYLFPWVLTAALAGCSDSASDEPAQPEQDPLTYLQFSVATSESQAPRSRAEGGNYDIPIDFEPAQGANELIRTMRFIVIDQSGNVELNIFIGTHEPTDFVESQAYLVKPEETKTIYLIANEESINGDESTPGETFSGFLDSFKPGISFDAHNKSLFEDKIITRQPNDPLYTNGQLIPMTEIFKYEVGPARFKENSTEQVPYVASMFITRVATKFTFNVTMGEMYQNIIPSSIIINRISTSEYLFPHNTVYLPAKYAENIPNPGQRIIKSYEMPLDYLTTPFTVSQFKQVGNTTTTTHQFSSTPVYLTETGQLLNEDGTENTNSYSFTLRLDGSGLGYGTEFDSELTATLPNLPSLPRNTHVVVDITVTDEFECKVTLHPYTGVYLDPIFGIDRE